MATDTVIQIPRAEQGGAMARPRRLYFYLVSFLSLGLLLTGAAMLIQVVLQQLLEALGLAVTARFPGREQVREQVALGAALALVSLPVWLLHWRTVQGWLEGSNGSVERESTLRRLYLYAVLAGTALTAFLAARETLMTVLKLAFGLEESTLRLAQALPFVLLGLLIWLYHWRIAGFDRQLVGEAGGSATLRRWYAYGLSTVGVLPLMANLSGLVHELWIGLVKVESGQVVGPRVDAEAVAVDIATIVAALVLWLTVRFWTASAVTVSRWHGEDERESVLRLFYFYLVVGVTIAWTLINAGQILRVLLLELLGVPLTQFDGEPMAVAIGRPLAAIAVYGLFWRCFAGWLGAEARGRREAERQAGVRRLYSYLVALVGLALLAGGIAGLLRLTAQLLLAAQPDSGYGRREAATYVSFIAIALPVWLLGWAAIQRRVASAADRREQRALTRRLYLYLVAFVAVAVVLGDGAQAGYQILLTALGAPLDNSRQVTLAHHLVDVLVAGVLLWYHWWLVWRSDLAATAAQPVERIAAVLISGLREEDLDGLMRFVRQLAPSARLRVTWADGSDQPAGGMIVEAEVEKHSGVTPPGGS